jgi:hypothetical protein
MICIKDFNDLLNKTHTPIGYIFANGMPPPREIAQQFSGTAQILVEKTVFVQALFGRR